MEKGSTVYEGTQAMVGSASLKLSAHWYLHACEGCLGAFIYLHFFFVKGISFLANQDAFQKFDNFMS